MATQDPGYVTIEHSPFFYEVIFHDFKRTTLDAWLANVEERYPAMREAPRILTLYDMRAMISFTPYAVMAFRKVINRPYKGTDSRLAFLVRQNLLNVRLRYAIERYRGGHGTGHVFFNRDEAFAWLRAGLTEPLPVPTTELPKSTLSTK
jgi:hypothetical protein